MNKQKEALRRKADSLLSDAVIARDRYCLICGNRAGDAHHIVPRSLSEALRYDMQNLVGLCRICHRRIEDRNPFAVSLLANKLDTERVIYLTEHRRDMVTLNAIYLSEAVERLKKELKKWTSH